MFTIAQINAELSDSDLVVNNDVATEIANNDAIGQVRLDEGEVVFDFENVGDAVTFLESQGAIVALEEEPPTIELEPVEAEVPGAEAEAEVPGAEAEAEVPGAEAEAEVPGAEAEVPGAEAEAEVPGAEAEVPGAEAEAEVPGAEAEAEVPGAEAEADRTMARIRAFRAKHGDTPQLAPPSIGIDRLMWDASDANIESAGNALEAKSVEIDVAALEGDTTESELCISRLHSGEIRFYRRDLERVVNLLKLWGFIPSQRFTPDSYTAGIPENEALVLLDLDTPEQLLAFNGQTITIPGRPALTIELGYELVNDVTVGEVVSGAGVALLVRAFNTGLLTHPKGAAAEIYNISEVPDTHRVETTPPPVLNERPAPATYRPATGRAPLVAPPVAAAPTAPAATPTPPAPAPVAPAPAAATPPPPTPAPAPAPATPAFSVNALILSYDNNEETALGLEYDNLDGSEPFDVNDMLDALETGGTDVVSDPDRGLTAGATTDGNWFGTFEEEGNWRTLWRSSEVLFIRMADGDCYVVTGIPEPVA